MNKYAVLAMAALVTAGSAFAEDDAAVKVETEVGVFSHYVFRGADVRRAGCRNYVSQSGLPDI